MIDDDLRVPDGGEFPIMVRGRAVVIERAGAGVAAWVPSLPGCVAVADDEPETLRLIGEGIDLHVEALERER